LEFSFLTSIGTPIDGVGYRGFGAARTGGTEGNLAMDKGRGQAEVILNGVEGVEHDTDWKASLARCTWSILCAVLYYASGSVSAGRPYSMVAIWF